MIPYKLETIFTRLPIANIVIFVFTILVTYAVWWEFIPSADAESMVLQDWDLGQMLSNTLLHANLSHLLGNMLMLWIFGNAVCAAVGSISYPFIYGFLAIMASATHLLFDGRPAIGASGAIYGVIGMAFFLFPLNKMKSYFFSLDLRYSIVIKSYWMIAFWVLFDNVMGAINGQSYVAYWAHIGGFTMGMVVTYLLILFDAVETYDPTIIDVITGRKLEREIQNIYALKETIEEKEFKAAQEQAALINQQPVVNDPILAGFEFKENATPILRLLNCMQKGGDQLCYFVNDGDAVREIIVESSEPPGVIIHPADLLGKKTPGWLQLQNTTNFYLRDMKLTISYDIGTGFRLTKSFVFQESEKRFTAV